MAKKHKILQGECVASLSHKYLMPVNKIWDAQENRALKSSRKDPYVLLPGDTVVIPDPVEKVETVQTGREHTFRIKTGPTSIKIRLLDGDAAVAHEPYRLIAGKNAIESKTDADGLVTARIESDLTEATLEICQRRFLLKIGYLDPITEISGVQGRLNNLGYGSGPADGILGPLTRHALAAFQKANGLKVTREPDEATCQKLKEKHGS